MAPREHSPPQSASDPPIPPEVVRKLSSDPGAPDMQALTAYVSAVHVRLFGVARDRARPPAERTGAILQLGLEGVVAGVADPKGVRAQVMQLLRALRGREELEPDQHSGRVLVAIDEALSRCD